MNVSSVMMIPPSIGCSYQVIQLTASEDEARYGGVGGMATVIVKQEIKRRYPGSMSSQLRNCCMTES